MTLFNCKSLVHKFDERLKSKYLKRGFVEKTLDSGEKNVHYYDNQLEDKPVLLFIHGFGGDGKISWWQQAKQMHEDYRVVIPDILWFGKSYSSEEPTLNAQIEMVKTIVEAEQLSNVHLVGISYGGFISLGYAQKYVHDLQTLIIVDSPGTAMSDEEVLDFCNRVGVKNVQEAFVPKTEKEVQRLLNFAFRKPPMIPSGIRKETIGLYFSKHPEEQAKLLKELSLNRNTMSGGVKLPTLILWGEDDQVFLVREAKELQQILDAELKIIPKAGHSLPEEQSKQFNEELLRFIELNR